MPHKKEVRETLDISDSEMKVQPQENSSHGENEENLRPTKQYEVSPDPCLDPALSPEESSLPDDLYPEKGLNLDQGVLQKISIYLLSFHMIVISLSVISREFLDHESFTIFFSNILFIWILLSISSLIWFPFYLFASLKNKAFSLLYFLLNALVPVMLILSKIFREN